MPSTRRRFGRLRKLASGRWQAGYTGPDGVVRNAPTTFATRGTAERWLSLTEADMIRGEWSAPERRRETLAQWSEKSWRTDHLRPSTAVRDTDYLQRYVLQALGSYPLDDLSSEVVQGWVDELADRLAPATVHKAAEILGRVVDSAVAEGVLPARPYRSVSQPRIVREEMRFLTVTELERLAAAIDQRYTALVRVAGYGGLRMSEVAGLRRKRVGEEAKTVEIAEIAVEVKGVIEMGPPKTRAGRRTVRLPGVAAESLTRHLRCLPTSDAEAFVFPAPEGGVLRLASWRTRFWNPVVASAGLVHLRPHDLVHTALALWIAAGANPLEVARRAGHTSVSFTLDRYGHLFPNADRDVVDRLDRLIAAQDRQDESPVVPPQPTP